MQKIIQCCIFLWLSHPIIITSALAAPNSLMPTLNWSCHKKNGAGQELVADANFARIPKLMAILTAIAEESSAEHHWMFSSSNFPSLKMLKVQKTVFPTGETTLVTYTLSIPADGNSHLGTSIWGFHPCTTRSPDIELTPFIATKMSEIFARHDTPTSQALMPIIHCITSATVTYAPRPVEALPSDPRTALQHYVDNRAKAALKDDDFEKIDE